MSDYINRNPYEMQKYAKSFNESVERINEALVKARMKIAACEDGLDVNCKRAITEYEQAAENLSKQMEQYRELARQLDRDADRMFRAIEEFRK